MGREEEKINVLEESIGLGDMWAVLAGRAQMGQSLHLGS